MRAISCLLVGCAAGATAHADLIYDGISRDLFAEAILEGAGGGSDEQEGSFDGPGLFDHSVTALVDRADEGFARGFASNVSDFTSSGISAHVIAESQAALGGAQLDSASAFGMSVILAGFHVDVRQTFVLSGSITYSGGPDLCVIKLREVGGADLFVLEADGSDGAASLEMEVPLRPGVQYEILGFTVASNEVTTPFSADESHAEYTFSFAPVPAPSTCAPALLLLGSSRRRRSQR